MLVSLNALNGSVADIQVLDVQHRVAGNSGQAHWPRRRPDRGVGNLLVRHEGAYAHSLHHVPHLYSVVPGRRRDQLVGVGVPVNIIHLSRVLLERHDGPLRPGPIEELNRPVTLRRGDDVLIGLTPGAVVDSVLREPVSHGHRATTWAIEVEDVQAPVPDDAVVLRSAHSKQVAVERRELAAVPSKRGGHPRHRPRAPQRPRTSTRPTRSARAPSRAHQREARARPRGGEGKTPEPAGNP
mmetsp:Transcript_100513/g.259609  ORF Transcript_100513/g.259609 Transcript_100513/m.259609 type:complete len:240 (+) Transcript_100513:360-1079(+)